MPVYRGVRGEIREIGGRYAETWPHPRIIDIDGVRYVEEVLPSETGWGMTFHAVRWPRTPVGTFFQQYVEGRASGFPFWPVFVFSLRAARDHACSALLGGSE